MFLTKEKFTMYRSVIGAHLIAAPWSFVWIYGNLSEYMASYVRFACSSKCDDGNTEWILPVYVAAFCPALFFMKPMVRKLGLKGTGLLMMAAIGVTLIGSAWTIRLSLILTSVMMGILNGFCVSITVCVAYLYVHSWAPKNAAILMASVSCTPNLLSVAQNQIITAIVNPNNLKPDAQVGPKMYFSQPGVLERVPTALLVQGAMTLCLQAIGYLLVTSPPKSAADDGPSNDDRSASKTASNVEPPNDDKSASEAASNVEKSTSSDHYTNNQTNSESSNLIKSNGNYTNGESTTGYGLKLDGKDDVDGLNNKSNLNSSGATSQGVNDNDHTSVITTSVDGKVKKNDEHEKESLTPSQVIKTPIFWTLWLSWCGLSYGLVLKNNYYKQFGLVYILDDKFLTLIGSLIPFATSIARLIFGYCIDKGIFNIKDSLVLSLSLNCVLCTFWFFSPMINKVVYLVFVLVLASSLGMFYVVFPAAAMRIFGPAHFSPILGMLNSAQTVTGVGAAVLVSPLLRVVGWFWLFITCSALSLVSLVVTLATKM